MTNEKIIRQFILENKTKGQTATRDILNGIYYYKGQTLRIEGDELYNYNTIILTRINENYFILNAKKYSITTSKIQSLIRYILSENNIKYSEINE